MTNGHSMMAVEVVFRSDSGAVHVIVLGVMLNVWGQKNPDIVIVNVPAVTDTVPALAVWNHHGKLSPVFSYTSHCAIAPRP